MVLCCKKVFGLYSRLLENRAQGALGHVAGVIRNSALSVGLKIEPNLVTSRGLPVEREAESLQFSCNVSVTETGKPAHRRLGRNNDRVVAALGTGWQLRSAAPLAARLK